MKDTNPTAKMAEEYKMHPSNVKQLTGVEASLYVFTLDQLTDFAEFHHREKMRELFSRRQKSNKLGVNCVESESYISLIFDRKGKYLADLTKNDEG